jgi:type IV secretory pathway VirB10-like protein
MNALHRLVGICSALSLGILATSVHAQQTSVPPAPPPDMQSSPSVPPPFPPMPTREPSHRHVDMGEHHRSSHSSHRSTRSSHHTISKSHHTTRHSRKSERHEAHARHGKKSHHEAAPTLSKKQKRQCKKMSYSQLLKHSSCAALLQSELKSESHPKHRSHSGKSAKHKKNEHHHATSRKTSVKHHKH